MSAHRESLHQARLASWTPDELKARLGAIVDGLAKEDDDCSPLDVALELLDGELESFVLFGRVGHLDPPREDGKVPVAILQHKSEDPLIDAALRETAKAWVSDQEQRN